MGTITGNKLRIRSGPSTGYSVLGYLNAGDRVEILDQKTTGTSVWAKIDKGWISMNYVKLDEQSSDPDNGDSAPDANTPNGGTTDKPETTPSGALSGVISGTTQLRIRSGPGTSYGVAGYYRSGTQVLITEQKQGGSIMWGKTEKGWISMNYVKLDTGASKPTNPSDPVDPSTPTTPSTPSGGTQSDTVSGTVQVSGYLRIRSGPGTSYTIVGFLANGDEVEILETQSVSGKIWGRISKGWISMSYVKTSGQNSGTNSGGTASGDTNPGGTVTKTGTATMSLCIRSGAGTNNKVVGYLAEGATVTVLETKDVNGITWGRIAKGWISLKYVK